MPRDITYSKLRQVSPGATHLQNSTDVVESTFPVGVKLYSSDISPSGRRGAPVYMNLTVERKGYNLPIHISIGIGTSPSNFRPLIVYRNVDPDNNTLFPVEFTVPLDLDVGSYILWYKVEPVVPDITKSPRLEVLTHSPVNSEVKTLTVSASSVLLTANFNIAPDYFRIFDTNNNALIHEASPASTSNAVLIDVGSGKNIRIEASKSGYYTLYDTFYMTSNLTRNLTFGESYQEVFTALGKVGFGSTTMTSDQNTLAVPFSFSVSFSRTLNPAEMNAEKARYLNMLNSMLGITYSGSSVNLPTHSITTVFNSNDDTTITYDILLTFSRAYPGPTNTTVIMKLNGSGVNNVTAGPFNLIINAQVTSQGTPEIVNLSNFNNTVVLDAYSLSTVINVHVRYPVDSSWGPRLGNGFLTASTGFRAYVNTNTSNSPDVIYQNDGSGDLPPNEQIYKVTVERVSEYSEGNFSVVMEFYNSTLNTYYSFTFNLSATKHVNAVTYVSQNINVSESRKGMFYYYTDTSQAAIELQPLNYISNTNAIGDVFRNSMANMTMYNRPSLGGPFFHTLYFDPINLPKEPVSVRLTIPIPSGTTISLSADQYNNQSQEYKYLFSMTAMIPTQSRQILTLNGDPHVFVGAIANRVGNVTSPSASANFLDLNADIRSNIGGHVVVDLIPSVVNKAALSRGLVLVIMYGTTYKVAVDSGNVQSSFNSAMGTFRGTSSLPILPVRMPFTTSQYGEYKIEVNL